MKDFSAPEKWNASEIKADFSTFKGVLTECNKDVGVNLINGDYLAALRTIQQLIDSFEILNEQLFCDVKDTLAAYYWLNGMVIACGVNNEQMRKKVADANFELGYQIADSGLRHNISQIRAAVAETDSAEDCNLVLGFFDDEDNYLGLLYQQDQRITRMTL